MLPSTKRGFTRWAAAVAVGMLLLVGGGAVAQQPGLARPDPVLREIVAGMPRGERQEVRVFDGHAHVVGATAKGRRRG